MRMCRFIRSTAFAGTYGILLVLLAGLITHRSYQPVWLGRYSTAYLIALVLLGVVTVLWKPIFEWFGRSSVCSWKGRTLEWKSWQKWAIALTALFLMLTAAEFYMRRSHPWLRQPDPYLVQQFHPYLQNEVVPNDARMHVNASGFRGDPIPIPSERDVLIFMLGGSTVYSHDVSYEQSHPVLLQNILRKKYPTTRFVVQNAGNEYHTSLHSLIKYVTRIRPHHPDLVIMWHGINDLGRSFAPNRFTMPDASYSDDYRHYLGPIAGIVRYYATPVEVSPLVHSVFANWLMDALFSDLRGALTARREQSSLRPIPVDHFPSLTAFENNLDALLHMMKADGVTVIMASEPSMYAAPNVGEWGQNFWMQKSLCRMGDEYPSTESLAAGMQTFNEVARRLAQRHGVPFLDLDAELPKDPRFMFDDCHYTAEGNELVAKIVARFLEENRIIQNLAARKTSATSPTVSPTEASAEDTRGLGDKTKDARTLAAPETHVGVSGDVGFP